MKFWSVSLAILAACIAASQTQAEDKAARKADADKGAIKKKFDKDGDGKLSDAERAAAKGETKKQAGKAGKGEFDQAALLKKFDKDGDGKLSEAEKAAAKEALHASSVKLTAKGEGGKEHAIPPAVLKKFDQDGDGKLNQQELLAAFAVLAKLLPEEGKKGAK